ncbi:class I SAM-dependent methyltransferase [candidate division WWE3 bacterium]|uniref:Class I SAM-dependent methyltransferase n=1 Tax=candidate division WWE3 bacterium TaxID=2053526 RepID=A0A955LH43_UNCKA|nr:class I SAM-dependent methyltransferase [candidate division WWE3 bacterium]
MSSQPKADISDYDQSGYDYRRYWDNRQYDNLAEKKILKKLLPKFSEQLIDIGGGYGRLIDVYLDRAKHITIFDYSQQLLRTAQSVIETNNYHHIETQQGDIYSMPFHDKVFDTALLIRVIHHLERPSLALNEISRIIRPGGTIILQVGNKKHLKNVIKAKITRNKELVNTKPVNISREGIFYQFHPSYIEEKLKENGFKLVSTHSVSNIRIPLIYRIIPAPLLVAFDQLITPLFNRFDWGPSLFIVAQKQ